LGAMVCGEMRPNTPKGVNNAKTALWCLRNCPMNSFCRYLVRANEGETSRGSIGWDSAKERVIALCEPQPKLFEVEVTEGVANKGNMVWGRRGRKRRNLQTHLQYE